MKIVTHSAVTIAFALTGHLPILELPRREALDLLEWLGLGRPEFGAVEVRVLLPLCRRRLWPERRNQSRHLRHVSIFVRALGTDANPDAIVHFG
jgi:hypothetical protein